MIKISLPQRNFCSNYSMDDTQGGVLTNTIMIGEVDQKLDLFNRIVCLQRVEYEEMINKPIQHYMYRLHDGEDGKYLEMDEPVIRLPYFMANSNEDGYYVLLDEIAALLQRSYNSMKIDDYTEEYIGDMTGMLPSEPKSRLYHISPIHRRDIYMDTPSRSEGEFVPLPDDTFGETNTELKLGSTIDIEIATFKNVIEERKILQKDGSFSGLYNIQGYIIDRTLESIQNFWNNVRRYKLIPALDKQANFDGTIYSVSLPDDVYEISIDEKEFFPMDRETLQNLVNKNNPPIRGLRKLVESGAKKIKILKTGIVVNSRSTDGTTRRYYETYATSADPDYTEFVAGDNSFIPAEQRYSSNRSERSDSVRVQALLNAAARVDPFTATILRDRALLREQIAEADRELRRRG